MANSFRTAYLFREVASHLHYNISSQISTIINHLGSFFPRLNSGFRWGYKLRPIFFCHGQNANGVLVQHTFIDIYLLIYHICYTNNKEKCIVFTLHLQCMSKIWRKKLLCGSHSWCTQKSYCSTLLRRVLVDQTLVGRKQPWSSASFVFWHESLQFTMENGKHKSCVYKCI